MRRNGGSSFGSGLVQLRLPSTKAQITATANIPAKNDQITLTYTKGSKMETFTGVFEKGCSVPSRDGRSMMPTDIPPGSLMTAFFNATTKKIDGKKTKENLILAIAFDVWQGQKVEEDKKAIYWCTDQRHLKFQAH